MISISATKSRHGEPLTKKELAQHQSEVHAEKVADAQEVAAKAKANGMKKRTMRAENGSVVEVWCYASSYHAMGFENHQIVAAEKFSRDWETAYRGLKGQGFEPGVDGGKSAHSVHEKCVLAQGQLAECKTYIGQRYFEIVQAVVVHGATITALMHAAKIDHRSIRKDVDNAFNDLDAFYSGSRKKDRTWLAFEDFNRERAELIAIAEREVG